MRIMKSLVSKRVLFGLAFAVVLVIALLQANHWAGGLISKQMSARQYWLRVEHKDRGELFLICHEIPESDRYDFDLGPEARRFKAVIEISRTVNTKKPISCVSYPIDWMEPSGRYPRLAPKAPDEKRVVFVGGSVVFGEGVRRSDAFPELVGGYLNKRLRQLKIPEKWISLNYGIMGGDYKTIYDYSFMEALKADPDLVVYVWTPQDIYKGTATLADEQVRIQRKPALPILAIVGASLLKQKSKSQYYERLRRIYSPENLEEARNLSGIFQRMKDRTEESGAEFRLVLFPVITGKAKKYPLRQEYDFVTALAKKEKIPVYDLTGSVLVLPEKQLQIHPSNFNPNFTAHNLAAKALSELLWSNSTQ